MQTLIAKYYCKQGKRVVIVEPSHNLMMQTILKLEPVDYKLQIMSIT
jgi:reverse gyrase